MPLFKKEHETDCFNVKNKFINQKALVIEPESLHF